MGALKRIGTGIVSRAVNLIAAHHRSLEVLAVLIVGILCVDIMTFPAGFGSNDDPGAYASQAYAVVHMGEMAHYTYWYDHPFVGWLQIAAYVMLTGGFGRSDTDVLMVGEFMIVAQLASCALIFVLMRRLGYNRFFAALAVALFGMSPLAVHYQKMPFLDNIAVPWLLASMVLVLSPKRSLGAAIGAGMCMTMATLTKETSALWVLALTVPYMLWQHYGRGNRLWSQVLFFGAYILTSLFYLLYAAIKSELLPGPGHVSLWDAIYWQLTRDAAGADTVFGWLLIDHWLLYAGAAAAIFALFVRRLRPIALLFGALVYMVNRGGYVPAPFVVGMLPVTAVLVAGGLGTVWPGRATLRGGMRLLRRLFTLSRTAVVAAVLVAAIISVAPAWANTTANYVSRDEVVYYQETIECIKKNVPKDAVIAVDSNMWLDLRQLGYRNAEWFYKLDLDPEIVEKHGIKSYRDIDYVAVKRLYLYIARDTTPNSVVFKASQQGTLLAQFGDPGDYSESRLTGLYVVYKVGGGRS